MSQASLEVPLEVVREIESVGRRSWPAVEEESLEGWILRAASGTTRRANSVHAVGPVANLDAAVERAVRWYRARGLVPRFHMHPAVLPSELDGVLDERGWRFELAARVLVADVAVLAREGRPGASLKVSNQVPEPWLDLLLAWRGMRAEVRASHRAILSRIATRPAFGVLEEGAEPRALGLAVADGEWVGLFDLVTDPGVRRRGWGRRLVEDLAAWGAANGARRAWLQVEDANGSARRLYDRLGFRLAYPYGYRVAPE